MRADSQRSDTGGEGVEHQKPLTAKDGVTRSRIMSILRADVRVTLKLFSTARSVVLDGRRERRNLGDRAREEAHVVVDAMPLSKERLMDHEYRAEPAPHRQAPRNLLYDEFRSSRALGVDGRCGSAQNPLSRTRGFRKFFRTPLIGIVQQPTPHVDTAVPSEGASRSACIAQHVALPRISVCGWALSSLA